MDFTLKHCLLAARFLKMRQGNEETTCSVEQAIDLISVVKEIHGLNSQERNKLLRDSENFIIHIVDEKGSEVKIDVEKLAGFHPLHLIALFMSSGRDEALLRYSLRGIRLLHSLCELAPRHSKLQQASQLDLNDTTPSRPNIASHSYFGHTSLSPYVEEADEI